MWLLIVLFVLFEPSSVIGLEDIDASGAKMTVRAGRSRFNLQTLPAADYPRIGLGQDQLQTLTLPQRELRSLLRRAEFAMAQQDIRYYLNGMLLVIDRNQLQAVATDGHRLSWASLAVAGETPERVWGALVTGNYFRIMGLSPVLGRLP